MGRKRKYGIGDNEFWENLDENSQSYWHYFKRLMELSISMFEWRNLPDTVDERYLEMGLFLNGSMLYFNETDVGDIVMRTTLGGNPDIYGIPTIRHGYAPNGAFRDCTDKDSVIIYNNMIHSNACPTAIYYAKRLWELDRITDINAKAQKTPILISCPEERRLTLKNLYGEYAGNAPVIYGDSQTTFDSLKVIQTGAPYIADKIYTLKTQIWNEALTWLGISNVNIQKRERLISDEVNRNLGGTVASRFSRLEARRKACDKINKMFGREIWCDFREDYIMRDTDEAQQMSVNPNLAVSSEDMPDLEVEE